MKRKSMIAGLTLVIGVILVVTIYWMTKPDTLGNINYVSRERTSNISDFTFEGKSGERLKFAFSSEIENGDLDIRLCDSEGNVVFKLDRAKALVDYFTLEKADIYTLVAEYSDFTGNFKVKVTK